MSDVRDRPLPMTWPTTSAAEWPTNGTTPTTIVADTPDWLARKLADEEADDVANERLLREIFPRPGRLLVTRPEVAAWHSEHRMASGLHAPAQALRNLREFGLRCTILRVNPRDAATLAEEDVIEGAVVVIPEYAGNPLFLGRETPYWIIGTTDIMCVVEGSAMRGAPADPRA